VAQRALEHFAEHWARCQEFHARGDLLMVGTFGDPQSQGSMSVWRTKKAAEEFATGDPFVTQGVVARWEIREWNEALT
jgi:uncharacterized protein